MFTVATLLYPFWPVLLDSICTFSWQWRCDGGLLAAEKKHGRNHDVQQHPSSATTAPCYPTQTQCCSHGRHVSLLPGAAARRVHRQHRSAHRCDVGLGERTASTLMHLWARASKTSTRRSLPSQKQRRQRTCCPQRSLSLAAPSQVTDGPVKTLVPTLTKRTRPHAVARMDGDRGLAASAHNALSKPQSRPCDVRFPLRF